ncbi:UDP-forming cellulose synthase catalytic subunit [Sutterella sp.]|uniref:UDP-forming cellulose synthase catalytic subunit n=1 Tax=Sutterella sp. TaxID=1981025 RepID=UPI0026E10A60|nr:UDP-forming cellulose synthase catalytic subunit [Sutterella sp.]MDO5532103.1 UDP-forming cellulose synthase catalytic subunit [Sutterella sp.]
MPQSDTRSSRSAVARRIERWRASGAGTAAIAVNGFFLWALYLIVPMERGFMRSVCERKAFLYPQVDFDRPRLLDPLRILVQTLWLLLVKPPRRNARSPWARLVAGVVAVLRAMGAVIGRLGDLWGALCLALVRRLPSLSEDADQADEGNAAGKGSGWGRRAAVTVIVLIGFALAALSITQPFALEGQVVFLSFMFFSMIALVRVKARITLMLLFVISIVVSARYLWWRATATLNTSTGLDIFFTGALLAAEIYAFAVMVLGYFQVCWALDRRICPLPGDRSTWPTVDVFIPTYNESLEVIKPTVYAALNLDWPAEKLRVHILDDGSRAFVEDFARETGAGYIRREEHKHAKAGNINHALTVTSGEHIVIFDCDHVPSKDFLVSTVGWLVRDPRIALVQTPHHFYSPDPFEKNLHLDPAQPIENSLFHDFIQKGNDTWNATMFCGSSAVMRRRALEEVGGIAIETVTEDAHTSLKLNRRGWKSAFISRPLASGLSTDTLAAHIGQRIRWARGMIQILRRDCPLLGRGLTLPQRLCFFNAMLHFLHGLPRIIFLLAPLPYMLADVYVIYATAASIFAYVVPHMVHSAVTNQRLQHGYRYPFLSGVYETVLSWYILVPTAVALIAPGVGKFNVTAKGGTIDSKYLDWGITKPYLVLLALNFAGLLAGFWKAFASPDPEYLTLAINMGWIVYNLMILGATMAVAVEEVQRDRFPRVPLELGVRVAVPGCKDLPLRMTAFSQEGVRVEPAAGDEAAFSAFARLPEGTPVTVAIPNEDGSPEAFSARLGVTEEGRRDLLIDFASAADERRFNSLTFARRGVWAQAPDHPVDDRFLTGFLALGRLALYGYRSMVEFLPGRTLPRVRDFIASLLPRTPRAGQKNC